MMSGPHGVVEDLPTHMASENLLGPHSVYLVNKTSCTLLPRPILSTRLYALSDFVMCGLCPFWDHSSVAHQTSCCPSSSGSFQTPVTPLLGQHRQNKVSHCSTCCHSAASSRGCCPGTDCLLLWPRGQSCA